MKRAIFNGLRVSWDSVRTSLWALPSAMFAAGAMLAIVMLSQAPSIPPIGRDWQRWLSAGSGEDARNLLSTLLSAVITMASIVFSVTVVSLSLAANTYGPRLIRTFRSSRWTQAVIGIFTLTIVYLLMVLRMVRGDASAGEVPAAAIAVGSLLSLVSVLALLAFIQSVSKLMVADEVVRRVREEFDAVVNDLSLLGEDPRIELPEDFEDHACRIRLPREGYVQSVDYPELVQWAERHDCTVRLDFRPGDFVVEGDHKLLIAPPPRDPEQARAELARFIVSGQSRTPTQDLEFAVRHLVEVAVRALSPGINDPFTAMAVIDRLRGGLARLCKRKLPSKSLLGSSGKLRVSRDSTSYRGAVDAAFHQIRQAGSAKPAILVHMLKAIGAIAEHVRTNEQKDVLAHHANLIRAAGARDIAEPQDLDDVEREYRRALAALRTSRQNI